MFLGAVIGAHTVLRENVPPYAIVIGNPAKIVKFRFPQLTIDALLRIKWWDWSDEKIFQSRLFEMDTGEFAAMYDVS